MSYVYQSLNTESFSFTKFSLVTYLVLLIYYICDSFREQQSPPSPHYFTLSVAVSRSTVPWRWSRPLLRRPPPPPYKLSRRRYKLTTCLPPLLTAWSFPHSGRRTLSADSTMLKPNLSSPAIPFTATSVTATFCDLSNWMLSLQSPIWSALECRRLLVPTPT
jgi:hypothetical protein